MVWKRLFSKKPPVPLLEQPTAEVLRKTTRGSEFFDRSPPSSPGTSHERAATPLPAVSNSFVVEEEIQEDIVTESISVSQHPLTETFGARREAVDPIVTPAPPSPFSSSARRLSQRETQLALATEQKAARRDSAERVRFLAVFEQDRQAAIRFRNAQLNLVNSLNAQRHTSQAQQAEEARKLSEEAEALKAYLAEVDADCNSLEQEIDHIESHRNDEKQKHKDRLEKVQEAANKLQTAITEGYGAIGQQSLRMVKENIEKAQTHLNGDIEVLELIFQKFQAQRNTLEQLRTDLQKVSA